MEESTKHSKIQYLYFEGNLLNHSLFIARVLPCHSDRWPLQVLLQDQLSTPRSSWPNTFWQDKKKNPRYLGGGEKPKQKSTRTLIFRFHCITIFASWVLNLGCTTAKSEVSKFEQRTKAPWAWMSAGKKKLRPAFKASYGFLLWHKSREGIPHITMHFPIVDHLQLSCIPQLHPQK